MIRGQMPIALNKIEDRSIALTEAKTESMLEPDSMADDSGRKAMALIAGCWLFHAAQSAKPELN